MPACLCMAWKGRHSLSHIDMSCICFYSAYQKLFHDVIERHLPTDNTLLHHTSEPIWRRHRESILSSTEHNEFRPWHWSLWCGVFARWEGHIQCCQDIANQASFVRSHRRWNSMGSDRNGNRSTAEQWNVGDYGYCFRRLQWSRFVSLSVSWFGSNFSSVLMLYNLISIRFSYHLHMGYQKIKNPGEIAGRNGNDTVRLQGETI